MLLKTKLKAVGKVLKEVSKSLCSYLHGSRSGLQRALCKGLPAVRGLQQRGSREPSLLRQHQPPAPTGRSMTPKALCPWDTAAWIFLRGPMPEWGGAGEKLLSSGTAARETGYGGGHSQRPAKAAPSAHLYKWRVCQFHFWTLPSLHNLALAW